MEDILGRILIFELQRVAKNPAGGVPNRGPLIVCMQVMTSRRHVHQFCDSRKSCMVSSTGRIKAAHVKRDFIELTLAA